MGTSTTVGFLESGVDNVIINIVTIPGVFLLLGSGLIGLLGLSTRFKKQIKLNSKMSSQIPYDFGTITNNKEEL
jgi:hypothetical protein